MYHHCKNICIFVECEVDKHATGSSILGREALHFAKKGLNYDETIRVEASRFLDCPSCRTKRYFYLR